ncbi:MAG: hypothetical protein LBS45_12300 [Synergistaceae bacterium]|jgi:hypothetical protein|nr:hypothetical protein [Synergistaceae bacterium]
MKRPGPSPYVRVEILQENGVYTYKSYTYRANFPLKKGDTVMVPVVRDGQEKMMEARVRQTNVQERYIEKWLRPLIKEIPNRNQGDLFSEESEEVGGSRRKSEEEPDETEGNDEFIDRIGL